MDIQQLLIAFYTKNKDKKAVRLLRDIYSHESKFPYDKMAEKRLAHLRTIHGTPDQKIKVCFLVTDPNIWNKQQGILEAMSADSRFEVHMLYVPDPFSDNPNAGYRFFVQKGYPVINARDQGRWYNLKALAPDYVFYGQPYNNYLPRQYRSFVVSRYAKVCILSYGMTISWNFMEIHPRSFHRDVYLRYAVVREDIEYNRKRFPALAQKGLQETKYLGFPAFSSFMEQKNHESLSFAFSRNDFRCIWTPRWITDEALGGSNFFRYKDVLFRYAREHPDADFLFRPHPMALDNFVSTGEMTAAEAAEFRKICSDAPNICLDTQKEYAATFWNSSVLISDFSSIVVEFFITGKPIVYCTTPASQQHYLDYFQEILDANYVVANEHELCQTLDMLKSGCDPKQEARAALIRKLFGNTLTESARLIADDIANDFYRCS